MTLFAAAHNLITDDGDYRDAPRNVNDKPINRGKGPILRGLPARAPYFHNGAAANLRELVNFSISASK